MSDAAFQYIPLGQLGPNSYNSRRFEENMTPQRRSRFVELVESVRSKGIIEPLLVRPVASGQFEVIAGERRYRAALEVAAGDETYLVPCMVRDVDDDSAFDLMVIENLQREDLTPLETAQAFKSYLERYGHTVESVSEISARTGIPTYSIRRQVRMLDLPESVLSSWRDGVLTQSHVEMFTRVADPAMIQDLLALCLRSKLTVRELGERIGATCPELERGFFDKAECLTCMYNTAVQSSLFPDSAPAGKCSNSNCFEAKQKAFLEENWLCSKIHQAVGTRGFRFGHRLGNERREPIIGKETAGRCLECDMFVSLLRLTGAVVSGYERACVGPRACFEELYITPHVSPTVPEPKAEEIQTVQDPVGKTPATDGKVAQPAAPAPSTKPATKAAPSSAKTPPAETGPVFNAARGEKYRNQFLKEHLQERISQIAADDRRLLELALLALVTVSLPARKAIDQRLGLGANSDTCAVAGKIFNDTLAEELQELLQVAVHTQIMEGKGVPATLRQLVAGYLGAKVEDWIFSEEYLQELGKSELVRIGEEPGVNIWSDEKVVGYRKQHHKGKALLSLPKEALVDMVLKSGVDLAGRVPAEVLGQRKG